MVAKILAESGSRVTHVTLRFPARLDYRPVAVDLVSALIQHVDQADRNFRNEMVTAFGEAFNNVAIHGYSGRSDGMLEIEAEMSPDQMIVRLIDTGRQVDFSEIEAPDFTTMPESGMGVFMMRALVDELHYRGGPPNVLSLIKRTTSAQEAR